jgi:hypothetical protein
MKLVFVLLDLDPDFWQLNSIFEIEAHEITVFPWLFLPGFNAQYLCSWFNLTHPIPNWSYSAGLL